MGSIELWIALVTALLSGIGLKAADAFFSRGQRREDYAKTLRDELRLEVQQLHARIDSLEKELAEKDKMVDYWREKYYSLLSKDSETLDSISEKFEFLHRRIGELHDETSDT